VTDEDGFRDFVNARWPSLVATAYLITADRGVAEDCVQEALSRLHGRWPRLRDGGSPVAYAHRSAVNAALSWRRRRRIKEVPFEPGFDRAGVAPDADTSVDPILLAALRSLPPRMRAAVALRYLEDRSESDTAELLGCSVGTVKSATHRGVARLRAALGEDATAWEAVTTTTRDEASGDEASGEVPMRRGGTA
jgi:RNA polymerase sigma-70 factor (sigma-E family)